MTKWHPCGARAPAAARAGRAEPAPDGTEAAAGSRLIGRGEERPGRPGTVRDARDVVSGRPGSPGLPRTPRTPEISFRAARGARNDFSGPRSTRDDFPGSPGLPEMTFRAVADDLSGCPGRPRKFRNLDCVSGGVKLWGSSLAQNPVTFQLFRPQELSGFEAGNRANPIV